MLCPVPASIFLPFLSTPWYCASIYPSPHKVMWLKEPNSHPMEESWSKVKTLIHFLRHGSEIVDLGCSLWESLWGRGHLWEVSYFLREILRGERLPLPLTIIMSERWPPQPGAIILWAPPPRMKQCEGEQSRGRTRSCGPSADSSAAGVPCLSGRPVKWDNPRSPRNPDFCK